MPNSHPSETVDDPAESHLAHRALLALVGRRRTRRLVFVPKPEDG